MTTLGSTALLVALVVAVYTIGAAVIGARQRMPELTASDAYTQVEAQLEEQAGSVWQIVRTQIPGSHRHPVPGKPSEYVDNPAVFGGRLARHVTCVITDA